MIQAVIHVYHTLFFIIPALQSGNYNKNSKLKYLFRNNVSLIVGIEMVNCCCFVAMYICHKLCINVYLSLFKMQHL
jgi:hypothetical protein